MTPQEALRAVLDLANRIEALAFEMKAPNAYTPQFVMLANEVRALRAALAQPEQGPKAFYVYKPTLPRGSLGNVADGDLPWVYDQDPSSGYSAKMLVYPASFA